MTRPQSLVGALLFTFHLLTSISVSYGFLSRPCAPERRLGEQSIAALSDDQSRDNDLHLDTSTHFTGDPSVGRRTMIVFTSCAVSLATGLVPQPSHAVEPSTSVRDLVTGQGDMPQLEIGLLESRVLENVMSPPPYAMEGSDVFYPDWFAGVWNVKSLTTDVQSPCGTMLFGGNATFDKARTEIGTSLNYQSRFISDGTGRIVADREFNVKSIAKVAMGENSVVDISTATPNKFSCLLSPMGSPSMLTVDLIVLNRRQENVDAKNFHCSEVVREIVSPVGQSGSPAARPQSPLLKEIETASLYRLVSPSEIRCIQRSATFLLPSQQDPMAYKAWEMSRGRPIDVRFYDVVYTKR